MVAIKNPHFLASDLRKRFSYDPDTGVLRRNFTYGVKRGVVNFRKVKIDGITILTPRLIWLLVYGYWPDVLIDHKDRDITNNRINNLREASYEQNAQNKACKNIHGLKGITFKPGEKSPWMARIQYNGSRITLGHFITKGAAAEAYAKAAEKYFNDFSCLEVNNA